MDLFTPFDEIADNVDKLPAKDNATIVLYCCSGRLSTEAAQTLAELNVLDNAIVDLLAQIVRSLNRLYAHHRRLEDARAETEQTLERLEADVERLRRQAETADEKAQLALPDEAKAREYLEIKQEALDRIQTLEERIASLRQSLHRIDTLRDELATREAELKALESTAQLAELEASIREDLLNGT